METYNQELKNALKIFGYSYQEYLKLSDEEIKKKYRKEAFKYHPDRFPGDKEKAKQMQELNDAYEILKKNKKNQSNQSAQKEPVFNLYNYMDEKIKILHEKIKEDGPNINLTEYVLLRKKIENMIYQLETDCYYYNTKYQFDRDYEETKRQIKLEMEKFKIDFYKNNYIDEQEVKIIIDYNTSVISFFNQLLNIKSKYSKEEKVKQILDTEIEEYKTYAGYERLKTLIAICAQNSLYQIKKNNFQNIEEEIKKMHQEIKNSVFEEYYRLKNKIASLDPTVENIKDESIKEQYSRICSNFDKGGSFYDIENMIENLQKSIAEYHEKELQKQKQKELEDTIVKIYQSLISKYSEALKQRNVVTEIKQINQIQEKLNQILQIFTWGLENKLESDFFNQLEGITFTDELKDRKTIENALKILNPNKSNVYIKREGDISFDQSCFYYFDEESLMIYKVRKTVTRVTVITREELEKDYIPLEEFLKSSQKINEFKKLNNEFARGIYRNETHIIYICKNQFNITTNSIFNKFDKTSIYDAVEMFEDKQQVLEMIMKQVKQKVAEYKKTSTLQNEKNQPIPPLRESRINNKNNEKNYYQVLGGEKEEIFKKKYIK